MPVPRLIHQIWLQGERHIPERHRRGAETWKQQNIGWEYRLWDEASLLQFMERTSPEWLPLYHAQPEFEARADVGRYAVLQQFGGVYADMDMVCVRPVEQLVADPKATLFVHVSTLRNWGPERFAGDPHQYIGNAFIAAQPGHAIWKEVAAGIASRDVPGSPLTFRTGPELLWPIVKKFRDECAHDIHLVPRRHILTAFYLPRFCMRWYGSVQPSVHVLHTNEGGRAGAKRVARAVAQKLNPFRS